MLEMILSSFMQSHYLTLFFGFSLLFLAMNFPTKAYAMIWFMFASKVDRLSR